MWLALDLLTSRSGTRQEGESGPWGGIQEARPQHVNKLRDVGRERGQVGETAREAEGRMGGPATQPQGDGATGSPGG